MPSLLDVPSDIQWNPWAPLSGRGGLTAGLAALLADAGTLTGSRVLELINEWAPKFEKPDTDWQWVYVARNQEAGLVKIGISSTPLARVQDFSRDPGRYDIVAVIPYCTTAHESWLCQLFASSLARGREWFVDNIETRALCWLLASGRNDFAVRAERWGLAKLKQEEAKGGVAA